MKYWKVIVGAIAIVWGTKTECRAIEAQVLDEGGSAHVEKCTKADIDTICRRG